MSDSLQHELTLGVGLSISDKRGVHLGASIIIPFLSYVATASHRILGSARGAKCASIYDSRGR